MSRRLRRREAAIEAKRYAPGPDETDGEGDTPDVEDDDAQQEEERMNAWARLAEIGVQA